MIKSGPINTALLLASAFSLAEFNDKHKIVALEVLNTADTAVIENHIIRFVAGPGIISPVSILGLLKPLKPWLLCFPAQSVLVEGLIIQCRHDRYDSYNQLTAETTV